MDRVTAFFYSGAGAGRIEHNALLPSCTAKLAAKDGSGALKSILLAPRTLYGGVAP